MDNSNEIKSQCFTEIQNVVIPKLEELADQDKLHKHFIDQAENYKLEIKNLKDEIQRLKNLDLHASHHREIEKLNDEIRRLHVSNEHKDDSNTKLQAKLDKASLTIYNYECNLKDSNTERRKVIGELEDLKREHEYLKSSYNKIKLSTLTDWIKIITCIGILCFLAFHK